MFWRGVWGYLPANVVQGLVGFGAIIAFTRILSPEVYGWYALALAAGAVFHTVAATWIESAMARFRAASAADGTTADHYATIYGLFALTAPAAPLAGGLVLLLPIPWGLRLALAAAIASALVRTPVKLAQEARRAGGQVGATAALDITVTGGGFIVGVALALAGGGAAAPFLGTAIACILCLPFAMPTELGMVKGGRFQAPRARRYAAYGVPLALSLIMALALTTTDRFLLAGFMDEATVGVYQAGYGLANRTLDVVFVWLAMAGWPAMVAAFEHEGRAGFERSAREQFAFMAFLTLPGCVGLIMVARPLAEVMLGEAFRDSAAAVVPWVAVSALMAGFTTHYFNEAFTLAKRTGVLTAAILAPAVLNLLLNLWLIPGYGLEGALWATTASFAFGLVLSIVLARGIMPMPFPVGPAVRCAAAAGAMAVAVAVLPSPGGLLELSLKAGVGAVVYALAALALDAGPARSWARAATRRLRRPQPATELG